MQRLLTFVLIGLAAQLVDGALGMAFGVTSSTLLIASGTSAALASTSVHLAEVFTTFASGASHWRFGNVNWRVVAWMGIPGAAGGFAGATVLSNIDGAKAAPWIAGLLLSLGLLLIFRFAFGLRRATLAENHVHGGVLGPLGLIGGFVDAVGGGGWGPISTPALLTIGRMEPRRAVGTTSAAEFLVTVAASAAFLGNLGSEAIDPKIVLPLALGGILVAPFAAWVVRHLRAEVLGTLVGGIIVVTNSRTLMRANDVGGPTRAIALLVLAASAVMLVLVAYRRSGAAVPAPTTDEIQAADALSAASSTS